MPRTNTHPSPSSTSIAQHKASQRTCTQCEGGFEVTDDDLVFLEEISPIFNEKKYLVPPPTLCPNCRYRRRLLWRNERNFYRRKCAATGRDIVSIWSPEMQWPPVYAQNFWWSDGWDPLAYGRPFDFSRPFFEQFHELYSEVPQVALNNQDSENAEYTNQCENNKDCYMLVSSGEDRECYHAMWLQHCLNCVDSLYLERSELCYELIDGKQCYSCSSSAHLVDCSDVLFSRNCIGCAHCIGCVNLHNKQYHIFNEPYHRNEYMGRVKQLGLDAHTGKVALRKKSDAFAASFPRKYYEGRSNDRFSGDYLQEANNALNSFNCRDVENIRHCQDAWEARNCRDLTETLDTDYCYSLEGGAFFNHALFSTKAKYASDVYYSSHCNHSKNCFGCVSLKRAQYCILNKQYTREEYEALVPRLIEHMRRAGEWGEHFPSEYSPFAYNETVAQDYFPLTKEEAIAEGYRWRDITGDIPNVTKTIPASRLPDSIEDIPDDILHWAIICEATGRPFKIIKQELEFYREQRLPIPHFHPDERHRRRMALRNPRKLWKRKCDKCGQDIQTTYAPERPEKVYCEECYLKEVY